MSLSNLARSAGSYLFSQVANDLSTVQQLLTMSALMAFAFVPMLYFRVDKHRAQIHRLEASQPA
jgi:hypothetical protein